MTHTYVIMKIPRQAYDFIREKLMTAGYQHAIHQDRGEAEVCDMHGIAVQAEALSSDAVHAPCEDDDLDKSRPLTEMLGGGKVSDLIVLSNPYVPNNVEPTERQVMCALVDWINENEHSCPGCGQDVSADKVGGHRTSGAGGLAITDCPVVKALLISAEWLKLSVKDLEEEEFEK